MPQVRKLNILLANQFKIPSVTRSRCRCIAVSMTFGDNCTQIVTDSTIYLLFPSKYCTIHQVLSFTVNWESDKEKPSFIQNNNLSNF